MCLRVVIGTAGVHPLHTSLALSHEPALVQRLLGALELRGPQAEPGLFNFLASAPSPGPLERPCAVADDQSAENSGVGARFHVYS